MQTVDSLQKIIVDRAIKQLDRDISKFANAVQDNPLFHSGDPAPVLYYKQENDKGAHPYFFFRSTDPYMQQLKEKMLPVYIERETRNFVSMVDGLQGALDAKLNNEPE